VCFGGGGGIGFVGFHEDVKYSSIGFSIAVIIMATWIAVFQTQWKSWGKSAIDIMVVVPERDRVGW
jgi:hypothetical protein